MQMLGTCSRWHKAVWAVSLSPIYQLNLWYQHQAGVAYSTIYLGYRQGLVKEILIEVINESKTHSYS